MEGKGSPAIFSNFSLNYLSLGNGAYRIDTYSKIKVQIESGYVQIVFRPSATDKFECDQKNYENRINICRIVKSMKGSILIETVVKKMMETASFEISCPFKIGEYFIRNMTLEFPPMLPIPPGYFCSEVLMFGKTKTQKKMEQIFSIISKVQLITW